MSASTPESKTLVQIYARSQRMQQAAGASLHGSNLAQWPARMADAFVTMQGEDNRNDHARWEANNQR